MSHYFCDGPCKGVASEVELEGKDKVCQMKGCTKEGEALTHCECANMESHKM